MSEKKRVYFTKMEGAGNDYVYVDALGSPTSITPGEFSLPDLACKISDRHFGVGGDGLIAILPSANADFRMRMFNADGSEAQMCGNGSRCVAKYVHDKGFTDKTEFTLETLAGIKTLKVHPDCEGNTESVTVDMGEAVTACGGIPVDGNPDSEFISVPVEVDGGQFKITAIGMGNPHGVVFVDEITDRHVFHIGKILETHSIWPERANIEFAKVKDRRHIEMRVWERGSGETLACGTGACATAVAAYLNGLADSEVEVSLPGGILHVKYDGDTHRVYMTGPAEFVFDGVYFCK